MPSSASKFVRLKSIAIKREFRAFRKEREIGLDADIVLLAGPNGTGKSSLIEAILLGLTRAEIDRKRVKKEPHDGGNDEVKREANVGSVDVVRLQFSESTGGGGHENRDIHWSSIGDILDFKLSPEFDRQIFYFAQDESHRSFDAHNPTENVRRVFEAFPDELEELIKQLNAEELKKALDAQELALSDLSKTVVDVEGAKQSLELVRRKLRTIAAPSLIAARLSSSFSRLELAETSDEIRAAYRQIEKELKDLEQVSGGENGDELFRSFKDEIAQLDRKIHKIRSQFEDLDDDLATVEDLEKLGEALDLVRRCGSGWKKSLDSTRAGRALPNLVKEVSLLRPERADFVAEEFRAWSGPRRQAKDDLDRLEKERDRLKAESRSGDNDEIGDLGEALKGLEDGHRAAATELHEALSRQREVEAAPRRLEIVREKRRHLEAIKTFQPPPREDLRKALDERARFFHSFFSLSEQKTLKINCSADLQHEARLGEGPHDRGLEHFSTGQRCQVAMALMVARNHLVAELIAKTDKHFPQVLLFDDPSTSYDLANLHREALFWRYLAYNEHPERRRQIIISSHNQAITEQLVDLLAPPFGRKMRYLEFEGLNSDGPQLVEYDVISSESLSQGDLSTALKEALCQPR